LSFWAAIYATWQLKWEYHSVGKIFKCKQPSPNSSTSRTRPTKFSVRSCAAIHKVTLPLDAQGQPTHSRRVRRVMEENAAGVCHGDASETGRARRETGHGHFTNSISLGKPKSWCKAALPVESEICSCRNRGIPGLERGPNVLWGDPGCLS